ncbi:MAG: hypothetical protein ACRCUT_07990 [Spirochaetota bacterium]
MTAFNWIVLPIFLLCGSMDGFDYGKVEKNQYQNQYFEFTAAIPENWAVQSKEQTSELTEKGRDLLAGDDENTKALIKASEVNSAYLLTVFKYEVGTAVEFNPSILIMAENLKNFPGIKNGNDYLFHTRKFLKQSQLQYDYLDEEFKSKKIGGKEFSLMSAGITTAGMKIKQEYHSAVIKGFSFNIVISYVSDEQKAELYKILDSMKFK